MQNVDPLEIKLSPYDLVVIDYGFDKRNATAFPREVVDMMRSKPNGRQRFIFAYLSIGEAENYRYYWQDGWLTKRPEWLEPENPNWPGNYLVQYWNPAWQSLIFGSPNAYLDRILDAGFDGVYLDGVDKFEQWTRRRRFAATDMVDFISAIAAYARVQRSDFKIIPQNGDGLLGSPQFLRTIDGFGREDLLYNEREQGARNSAGQHRRVDRAAQTAGRARQAGLRDRIHDESGAGRRDAARNPRTRLRRLYREPRTQVAVAACLRMRTAGLFAMKVR